MDIKDYFFDGTIAFLIVLVVGIIACTIEKHDKGDGAEFDWKEFGRWVRWGLILGFVSGLSLYLHNR